MMSLKPRYIDFQETWASLKETVAGVVALRGVQRSVWNTRFSDVYALCVAHPEPLADKLYDETRAFLEEHVSTLLERVRDENSDLNDKDFCDGDDGLLARYVSAWTEFSQGVAYLNNLYSYLNMQHIKRQKISDAEIIYGSVALVGAMDQESRQLEVGELGLTIWERVLVRPLAPALTARIVRALGRARAQAADPSHAYILRTAIHSTVHVSSFRVRNPLELYNELVLQPYLEASAAEHAAAAAAILHDTDISQYMRHALEGLERSVTLCAQYLHSASSEAVRTNYERAAVEAHLPSIQAHQARLLKEACEDTPAAEERREDLRRMYTLLRPLPGNALRPLVEAAHSQAAKEGLAAVNAAHSSEEAHIHFVQSMLALHGKYTRLFEAVFGGAQMFQSALDKACSETVNAPRPGDATKSEQPCRAPELLARYCDSLLRKRGGGGGSSDKQNLTEAEVETKLAGAIVVFKYVDDKDVFQKYYARALARRLIHQLSNSMEQEEAMINRLKAACGYEFTNKLHRMFTDVSVSGDLNNKFQQHLRDTSQESSTGFSVQVLQAGAWPLGGAMAPLAPPPQLERGARLFEAFYRASFSGRRLAWLHHLCTGELRTRYTQRVYHVSATTPQCAILLAFESVDTIPAAELRQTLQMSGATWARHVRPLVDAGLLTASGAVEDDEGDGTLSLNLTFSCKRTKVRLTAAAAPPTAAGAAEAGSTTSSEPVHCEDDRKMYLQAAIVRIMKQRKVLRHNELVQEVCVCARGSFAPSVAMIKKCIEALIDKQYLERTPQAHDTYSYLA